MSCVTVCLVMVAGNRYQTTAVSAVTPSADRRPIPMVACTYHRGHLAGGDCLGRTCSTRGEGPRLADRSSRPFGWASVRRHVCHLGFSRRNSKKNQLLIAVCHKRPAVQVALAEEGNQRASGGGWLRGQITPHRGISRSRWPIVAPTDSDRVGSSYGWPRRLSCPRCLRPVKCVCAFGRRAAAALWWTACTTDLARCNGRDRP